MRKFMMRREFIFIVLFIALCMSGCKASQNEAAVTSEAASQPKANEVSEAKDVAPAPTASKQFYDFSVKDAQGADVPMTRFEGKVVLVVNTATKCGFTPQYSDLEAMYESFHARGLEILDIPCNQFLEQAPGSDEEIHAFCTNTYNTQFAQMKKADVNGPNAIELYKFLKSQKGFEGFKGEKAAFMDEFIAKQDADYKNNADIKWNFTKFVIDREGHVVKRFEPTEDMAEVSKFVEGLL